MRYMSNMPQIEIKCVAKKAGNHSNEVYNYRKVYDEVEDNVSFQHVEGDC